MAECAIDSRHVETDRVWHTMTADLGRFAGRSVEIAFDTRPLPAPDGASWSTPRDRLHGLRRSPYRAVFEAMTKLEKTWWAALVAALAVGCGEKGPPNVVLVVIDTLRADHTSLHGYERDTTPGLREWAKGGTVFERAYSASSWTLPSMSMLMTGQVQVKNEGRIFPRQSHLAEILRDRGYHTGAVIANQLLTGERGFERGFDEYELYQREHKSGIVGWTADEVTDLALDFTSRAREPFFLQLHYFDPHDPYQPVEGRAFEPWDRPERMAAFRRALPAEHADRLDPRVYRGIEERIAQYDSEVLQADRGITRFLRHLEEEGLDERTLVVITADHGEGLWQRAQTLGETPNQGAFFPELYYWHGVQLFDEQVRVPLVFRGPGVARGQRIDSPASLIDVVPTLLALLDLPRPELLAGTELLPERRREMPVFSICSRGRTVTVDGRFRLHEPRQYMRDRGVRPELFDLEADPLELEPLVDPVKEAELRALIDGWIAAYERFEWSDLDAIDSERVAEDLALLGYASVAAEPRRSAGEDPAPDLALEKAVDDATPTEHQRVVYRITLTNTHASASASSVRVRDVLPAGVSFVSATPSRGSYAVESGVWTIGTLDAGSNAILEIAVQVDAGTVGRAIVNTVDGLELDQEDPNAANDWASVELHVDEARQ